jgi:hypothetical protein
MSPEKRARPTNALIDRGNIREIASCWLGEKPFERLRLKV